MSLSLCSTLCEIFLFILQFTNSLFNSNTIFIGFNRYIVLFQISDFFFFEICLLVARQLHWLRLIFLSIRICASNENSSVRLPISLLFQILIFPLLVATEISLKVTSSIPPSWLPASVGRLTADWPLTTLNQLLSLLLGSGLPSSTLAQAPGCCQTLFQAKAPGCSSSGPTQLQDQPILVCWYVCFGNE